MPKIQGKQIADNTITQELLNLVTPTTGQTDYAATVEYVNDLFATISGSSGVIGEAEDGDYTDGLFTDFTPQTPTGTAVDRFNETLKLLAPTPPTDNWNNVFSGLNITSSEYSARALTTGTVVNNITTDTTPSYSLSVNLGTSGRNADSGTFTMLDEGSQQDTVTLTTGDDTRGGIISISEGDPYQGVSGSEGFWNAVVSMSVSGVIGTPITASASSRTMTFTHPGSDSPETYTYYVDDATTPSVSVPTITAPTMSSYISGVPTLTSGQSVSGIAFNITNAVSYFYNNSMYDITGTLVNNDTGNAPASIPTTHGQAVTESGLSVTVANNQYSDTSFGFTVTARSANNQSGSNNYTSSTLRVDTKSDESIRLTSGSGSYPSSGYGSAYDSTQSLVDTYTTEMMLKNAIYQYPNGDYTAFSGPDYSAATGTRWATFNLGSFSNNSAFTLTINGASGISSIGQANLLIEVKIEGATFWVDGNSAYSNGTLPGSSAGTEGLGAVAIAYPSTATVRRITFGAATYTGNIMVRIGFTGTGPSFTSLSASDIA